MSVLRLLTPSFGHSSHHAPTLTLHVPAYGVMYLQRPRTELEALDNLPGGSEASTSNTLRGELEINVPREGRRRCKSIKVGIKTVVRLAMGPVRGWEEDVLFERESEHRAATSEGIWLEEGVTKYEFTFELPTNLATHDWHPEGVIRHDLFAEIEGIPTSHFSFFHRAQSPSHHHSRRSASRHQSPSATRHASPSAGPSRHASPSSTRPGSRAPSPGPGELSFLSSFREPPSISLVQQVNTLPPVPTYEQSEAASTPVLADNRQDGTWLEGSYKVTRGLRLIYNPHPTGGINSLDERTTGEAPGLGQYELTFRAPAWTVGCMLSVSFRFLDLPPTATVFDFRVNLLQNISARSPRDQEEQAIVRPFTVIKQGKRPNPEMKRPGRDYKAIWRGGAAGGNSEGGCECVGKGRMPRDRDARPSTVEGVNTPLKIAHQLAVEVVFSIWSEDAYGQPIKAGPGEQRRLKIARPVVLPSCAIIPQTFSLPAYPTHQHDTYTSPNAPCALCHTPIEDKLCRVCPFDQPSHVRHDLPPKLVGNKEGICPLCSQSLFPEGEVGRKNCACALNDEEFEKFWRIPGGGASREAQLAFQTAAVGAIEADKEEWEHRGRERVRRP